MSSQQVKKIQDKAQKDAEKRRKDFDKIQKKADKKREEENIKLQKEREKIEKVEEKPQGKYCHVPPQFFCVFFFRSVFLLYRLISYCSIQ